MWALKACLRDGSTTCLDSVGTAKQPMVAAARKVYWKSMLSVDGLVNVEKVF